MQRLAPPIVQSLIVNQGKRLFGTSFILIACMPKSGSTFLARMLASLARTRMGSAVPEYGRREQELEEASIIKSASLTKHSVFQNHVCHSAHLEGLVKKYPFEVIVLCRDLRDIAASIFDHLEKDSTVWPMTYCDDEILASLDKGPGRLNFIIDLIMPWYINFYVSWKKYQAQGGQIRFITYEEMMANKQQTLKSIAIAAGIKSSDVEIAAALNSGGFTRLNKGVSGRGAELFRQHPDAEARLARYIGYYPSIDFSPVFPALPSLRSDART